METRTQTQERQNHDLPPVSGAVPDNRSLAPQSRPWSNEDLVPRMVQDARSAKAALKELQEFVREVMVEGIDFGQIPGTDKKSLLKPGAEKLLEIYGYAAMTRVTARIEDWKEPFFHYEVEVSVVSKRTGNVIGIGIGSCNSKEARYRWRNAARKCPACGNETIIQGKKEYGGGWLCFKKKGGCGAKFPEGAQEIESQPLGKVENDDVYTLVNTILKMAKKRGLVDAALTVTRSSNLFVVDDEDLDDDAIDVTNQSRATTQRRAGNGHGSSKAANGQEGNAPAGDTEIMIAGKKYKTAGIQTGTVMRLRSLMDAYNAREGDLTAAVSALKQQMGVASDLHLTDEQGKAMIGHLEQALAG